MSERAKLGGLFGGTEAPGRGAGLSGLLPPAAPTAEPTPIPTADPTPAPTTPRERPTGETRARRPRTPARQATSGGNRIVPVVLDASVLTGLREAAAHGDQTQGGIALRAIEAHAEALQSHFRDSAAAPVAGKLFGATAHVHRRAEPGVQTQLRISPADADTLDRLAGEWSAPSRSALVNEALRRHLAAGPSGRQ